MTETGASVGTAAAHTGELGAGAQWRPGLCAANMGATSLIPLMMSLALLRRPADNVRNVRIVQKLQLIV